MLIAVFAGSLLCLALAGGGGTVAAHGAVAGPLPPDTTITFGPLGWTNLTRPVYGYRSDNPEAWFECRLDSGPFVPCGPATYEVLEGHPGAELSEGAHTIEVRAVGPDEEADPTPARALITVDTDPPTASIVSWPTSFTRQRRPTFTLRVEGEDGFRCRIIGKNVRIKAPSCDGETSFRAPRPLPEGAYELVLAAFDLAGNETEDRVEFSVRTKPGPPPPPPNPYRGSTLYTGRGDGVKKVVFRLRGRKLIHVNISVNLACNDGRRRYRSPQVITAASPRYPISVNRHGKFEYEFEKRSFGEEITENLTGQITPQKIVGSIAVRWSNPIPGGNETCHTGPFRPGRTEELNFRARHLPAGRVQTAMPSS
jgi:hypothetical protein